jgi:hypothetical protein
MVAVELSFGRGFDLDGDDADILLQVTGGAVLWQKERLLNLALKALPVHCRHVAWLDGDIVFDADDWAERTSAALETVPLLQPFRRACPMPRGWRPDSPPNSPPEDWSALAWQVTSGLPIVELLEGEIAVHRTSRGYAWAARREILDRHGFYDACIVGGGDSAFARAAYGRPEGTVRVQQWDQRQADHYLAWAGPLGDEVDGSIGSIEGTVRHLWHGGFANRSYRNRYAALKPFDFDPHTDIALTSDGVWRWASEKPELHRHMRDYFANRREDE